MIPSYSSIYNLGHAAISELFKGPVIIQEKIDGSQFSFTKRTDTGELECRSKGAVINMLAPEKMFAKIVETVRLLDEMRLLTAGEIYRGEYLAKPRHNVLVYDRTPRGHFMLFDVNDETGSHFKSPDQVKGIAEHLGFEVVPTLFTGMVTDVTTLRTFLEKESVLGGQKIEGVVIKPLNYDLFGRDKKLLMGKFVSEEFKEVHAAEWKQEHGTKSNNEIIQLLAASYATPARWAKALIHLQEKGVIQGAMNDIPALMAEVPIDVLSDSEAEIKQQLWDWAWPQLRRSLTKRMPEWYKDLLAKKQFEDVVPGVHCPANDLCSDCIANIPADKVVDPSSPYANLDRSREVDSTP